VQVSSSGSHGYFPYTGHGDYRKTITVYSLPDGKLRLFNSFSALLDKTLDKEKECPVVEADLYISAGNRRLRRDAVAPECNGSLERSITPISDRVSRTLAVRLLLDK